MRDVPAARPTPVAIASAAPEDHPWWQRGACTGTNDDGFYDIAVEGRDKDGAETVPLRIAWTCWQRCAVREQCLRDAMKSERGGMRFGYRGGYTPEARHQLAKEPDYRPDGPLPGARKVTADTVEMLDTLNVEHAVPVPGEWIHTQTVVKLAEAGVDGVRAAKFLGITRDTLRRRLIADGRTDLVTALGYRTSPSRAKYRIEDVVDLLNEGQTPEEVAFRFNVSVPGLRAAAKRAGRQDVLDRLAGRTTGPLEQAVA